MDNPMGIPPEDLPEPIRRLLEAAQAAGGKVHVLPLGQSPEGILSQVMQLGGDEAEDKARLECGCHWCKLEHELHLVTQSSLTPEQKYEAVDVLFNESAEKSAADGDQFAAFSKKMQALAYRVNQENRKWFLEMVEARIKAVVETAAKEFGIDSTAPDEVLSRLALSAFDQSKAAGDATPLVKCASLSLMLKDLLELRRSLTTKTPKFAVSRASDGRELAENI